MPSLERMRFTSSGTEAAMSAVRLARGATGRDLVVKFSGGYHGHSDGLLVEAGSGVTTLAIPGSAGVPTPTAAATIVVPYNDPDAVAAAFVAHAGRIAAVIVEPVAANAGVLPPAPGFLDRLREITAADGALLIFDEVITGFRVAFGGAQELYGVTPDMTCLGKIIGGGLPVGCYGGREEIMNCVSPVGQVYQAGTLSGNPLAMAAGIAMLKALRSRTVYKKLEALSASLAEGLAESARKAGVATSHTRVGSMMTMFFTDRPIHTYDNVKTSDTKRYARYFHAMLRRGVYFAPSQFEAAFVSAAHTAADVQRTVALSEEAMREAK